MAQQKGKKNPDRGDKSSFFAARSVLNKTQSLHETNQVGGKGDTLPLQNSPDPRNLPVTQDILRACLDEMSDKLLNKIQASVTTLSKNIQELGERTAHVEHRMDEYADAHNDLADHVQALEKQFTGLFHLVSVCSTPLSAIPPTHLTLIPAVTYQTHRLIIHN
ncbi:Hypothetical predicted protein [Pelobates cultripes]|uniref:Uncharacterized protein n=1 Tax=Pelobates cultripes TaxID=61616 RepID=A0AAD1RHC4_PELCU|nr:Hypothetical predicted protein [Pelobates cultripes]